ncbi:MAG: dihydroneopterin aldolase [Rhodospirillaceae bacterium]|nr:dihydroneopterin aldolase [Rhodospirillaceae bacterium]
MLIYHIFVNDLELQASIGVYNYEKIGKQRIRINLDLVVHQNVTTDNFSDVLCYEIVVDKIRNVIECNHVNLLETLALYISTICLEDKRVKFAKVRVEKLDVFSDVTSVGVEIERFQQL